MPVLFVFGTGAVNGCQIGIDFCFARADADRGLEGEWLGLGGEHTKAIGSLVRVISAQHVNSFLVVRVRRAFDGFDHAGFTAVNIGGISRHIHDSRDHFLDVSITDVSLGGHGHMTIDAVAAFFDFIE